MEQFVDLYQKVQKFIDEFEPKNVEEECFIQRFKNKRFGLEIGGYIDLYMFMNGIRGVYGDNSVFDEEYYKTINENLTNPEIEIKYSKLIVRVLDFLIWIRKEYDSWNININFEDRRYILKLLFKYEGLIKNIHVNENIPIEDRIYILLFVYCGMLEGLKNIIQESLLLEYYNTKINKKQPKKDIALGDFREIVKKFENGKYDATLSNIIDVEFRNKIFHAKYELEKTGTKYNIKYYRKNGKYISVSYDEFYEKLLKIDFALLFCLLFYLRIFEL